MRVAGVPFGLGIDKPTDLARTRGCAGCSRQHYSFSGCPASLLVRVICCSLVIAVPLLRLLVGRASDGADSADRD
jgi:hypothetical protein